MVKPAMILRYTGGSVSAMCLVLSEPDAVLHAGSNIMGFSGGAMVKKIHLPEYEMEVLRIQSLYREESLE